MFPSTYSSLPYPCFPSSSSTSSSYPYPFTTFLNPENASSSANLNYSSTLLLHDPLPAIPYNNNIPSTIHNAANIVPETLITNLAVSDHHCVASAMPKQQDLSGDGGGGNGHNNYGISYLLTKKKAPKKDRHSKIHTSQGLRDRRVRLSIDIARKFFDLQDMLGFDKASNTLEWLFNKSKKAIKDLTTARSSGSGDGTANTKSLSSNSSECEEVVSSNLQGLISTDHESLIMAMGVADASKERKYLKRAQKESPDSSNVRAKMKESREKARARARERTSNKVQDLKKKCPAIDENPQILHPHPQPNLVGSEAPKTHDFNVIEESIVIKRKLKPSMISSSSHHHHHHHHHQNLVIPKEASFNNSDNHSSFANLCPNWDANGTNGRSSFCAIASMNLSTGLQIFGKSWEECTNPRPH